MSAPFIVASELSGRPVIDLETGEKLGEVASVVFDPLSHRLVGIALSDGTWSGGDDGVLPASAIAAIGDGAVMARRPAASEDVAGRSPSDLDGDEGDDEPGSGDGDRSFPILGASVLSEDGEGVGRITDIVLQAKDHPRAVGYQVEEHGGDGVVFVPLRAQRALSEESLIVAAPAASHVVATMAELAGVEDPVDGPVGEADAEDEEPIPQRSVVDETWTRRDLYELAKSHDLAGRSAMTKAELLDALRTL